MFRTMQYAGFLTRIQMTTAFRQLLAMSSWHLVHLNQTRPRNEYLRLSLSATQALQEQINDPSKCCTDNAIGAVLLFACCAVGTSHEHNTHAEILRISCTTQNRLLFI